MANRNISRFRRGSVQRRESLWIFGNPIDTTLSAASTAALVSTLNAAALALRPFTVVRTRGQLWIRSDQTAAAEDYAASLGMAVVSEQAAAIGVTAVPTPEADRGSDMFFLFESGQQAFTRFDATGVLGMEGIVIGFDSKAMRKVNGDQDIAVVIETASISLGAQVMVSFRMLVKLH